MMMTLEMRETPRNIHDIFTFRKGEEWISNVYGLPLSVAIFVCMKSKRRVKPCHNYMIHSLHILKLSRGEEIRKAWDKAEFSRFSGFPGLQVLQALRFCLLL